MRYQRYIELAARYALSGSPNRAFLLGAVARRSDGTLVHAVNGPSQEPARCAHAECRLAKKLDVGSTVFVVRVRRCDGTYAMAKPCSSCYKILKYRGVRRVYYTTDSGTCVGYNL